MARSLALVGVTASVLALGIGAAYGARDGVLTWLLLAALGTGALATAHVLAHRRRHLGSLRRQFGLGVGVAVGQMLIAAGAGAALMFVSTHDAVFVMVIAVLAGVVAARAAQLFASGVMTDIEALGDTMRAVGDGSREPSARTGSSDELAVLATATNATITKLDAAESARRNLIAAVSHDLRTPITSLRLLAQAVDDEIVDVDTRRRYLREMGTHIHALSSLIDDLFELSRLEAGEVEWTLQQVEVGQLVGDTVEAMRAEAAAGSVRVRARVPDAATAARAHPEKVQRVLFNLIQNAIRHTPPDGSVTVMAQTDGDGRVVIEVADTGEGIRPADRERVFEPFFRGGAEAARTRAGAGLGLAISRAIVEAHGGRIWLADSPAGTRVRFSLPSAS